jgi:Zn-finger in Ran binding protein and others
MDMHRCLNCGQTHRVIGYCPHLFSASRFSSAGSSSSTLLAAQQQQRNNCNNNAIDLTTSPSPTRNNAIDLLSDDEEEEDRQHGFEELSDDSSLDDDMEIDEEEEASVAVEDERKMPSVAAATTTTNTIGSSPTNSTSTDEDAESSIDDDSAGAEDHKVPALATRTLFATAPTNSTSTEDDDENYNAESDDDDDEIVEYWQCPVCTLLNSSDRTICAACQSSSRGTTGQENHHHRHHHHRHRAATSSSFASSLASSPSPFHTPPFGSCLYAQAIASTPSTTGSAGLDTTGALRRQRSTVYDHHHQTALQSLEEARLDRQRQHHQHMSALIDLQRQQLDRQRQQTERWLQRQQHHQAAATAHLQRHGALSQHHDRTLMHLATHGRSRSSLPMQRYAAMIQAARNRPGTGNTDGMNYEQLLQAYGDGTENMGASDHDIQQLPVSKVIDPDKDLPETGAPAISASKTLWPTTSAVPCPASMAITRNAPTSGSKPMEAVQSASIPFEENSIPAAIFRNGS